MLDFAEGIFGTKYTLLSLFVLLTGGMFWLFAVPWIWMAGLGVGWLLILGIMAAWANHKYGKVMLQFTISANMIEPRSGSPMGVKRADRLALTFAMGLPFMVVKSTGEWIQPIKFKNMLPGNVVELYHRAYGDYRDFEYDFTDKEDKTLQEKINAANLVLLKMKKGEKLSEEENKAYLEGEEARKGLSNLRAELQTGDQMKYIFVNRTQKTARAQAFSSQMMQLLAPLGLILLFVAVIILSYFVLNSLVGPMMPELKGISESLGVVASKLPNQAAPPPA